MIGKIIETVVIEDEKVLREELVDRLNETRKFKVIGQAASVTESISLLKRSQPECVFMDIHLKGGSAFDVIEGLQKQNHPLPAIILNTAHRDFEFAKKIANMNESNILYLFEKPFYSKWEEHISNIFTVLSTNLLKVNRSKTHISLTCNNIIHRIKLSNIYSVRVAEKGQGKCKVVLSQDLRISEYQEFVLNQTLTKFSKNLPDYFIPISRHVIINGEAIKSFNKEEQVVTLNDSEEVLSVRDRYKEGLIKYLFS